MKIKKIKEIKVYNFKEILIQKLPMVVAFKKCTGLSHTS